MSDAREPGAPARAGERDRRCEYGLSGPGERGRSLRPVRAICRELETYGGEAVGGEAFITDRKILAAMSSIEKNN